MYMFDIETLSVESTAVVLSAACVHFDPTAAKQDYNRMVREACFVKFNADEQIKVLHRAVDNPTLSWWGNRAPEVKAVSLTPKSTDLSVMDGLVKLASYAMEHGGASQVVWSRGSLDQMAIESLSRAVGRRPIFDYNQWRDVRTYIDLTYGSTNGYVDIEPGLIDQSQVMKHNPVWDCVLDVAMMLDGMQKDS